MCPQVYQWVKHKITKHAQINPAKLTTEEITTVEPPLTANSTYPKCPFLVDSTYIIHSCSDLPSTAISLNSSHPPTLSLRSLCDEARKATLLFPILLHTIETRGKLQPCRSRLACSEPFFTFSSLKEERNTQKFMQT